MPYSAYPRFHEVMAEESAQTVVAALTDHILPLVPGLIERLENGIEVLDVGCGSGRALNCMARAYPNSCFTGYDISEEAIARARAEAEEHGTKNVHFEVRDVAALGEEASYDLITTFDVIHDQAKPASVLRGIAQALRRKLTKNLHKLNCGGYPRGSGTLVGRNKQKLRTSCPGGTNEDKSTRC